MSKPQILAEPVLVGREKELEELHLFLNQAIKGKGKTVFVSGEAGSGKTRLTREFLSSANKLGMAVMAGWCLSDSHAPFFPFIEAFNSYFAASMEQEPPVSFQQPQVNVEVPTQVGVEEREVTSWLAGPKPMAKAGKAEMLSPEVWKDQALAAVAKTVHTIALQAPVILFLEDLHWADSASLALLHYLSRAIKDSDRILLLATFRSEELTTDAEGHPHPLAETLRMMRREELFSEIKLPSLNKTDVSKMAESMIGSCVLPELAEKLALRSGGSPLFIVESVRMLNEHGGLVKDGACVRLDIDKVSIPSKVKDIILRRVGSLRREQRRALDAASVIGEPFDFGLLSLVLDQDPLLVVESLGTIAQSTSLLVCEGDSFRFDHAKSREAIYEEIPLPIKKSYHARIAEKLENSPEGTAFPLSDIAYHYSQSGNREKAIKYALVAGKDELARYSNAQAIKHFQQVLENLPEGHDDDRKAALDGLGDAYNANSNRNEAIRTFDKLAELETGALKLRAIRKAMDVVYQQGSNPDLLLEYARKAEELGVDDRLEMARVIDNRGKAWGWSGHGDWKMDLADYDYALQVFEEENSLADVAEALWRSGSLTTQINPEVGFSRMLRSVAVFRELGDARNEVKATNWLANALNNRGVFYAEARRVYAKVLAIGEKLGMFSELCSAHGNLGVIDEREGNMTEALSHFFKALEYSQKAEIEHMKWATCSHLLRFYSLCGELEKAAEYFDKLSNLPPELFSNVNVFYTFTVAKGVYFAAENQWNKANQAFDEVFQGMKKFNFPHLERNVRLCYSWALRREGRPEEAEAQLEAVRLMLSSVKERMSYCKVQLSVMVPRRIAVDEEFNMRLDLVNVGKQVNQIVNVEGIALPEFTFVSLPNFCNVQDNALLVKGKSIGPYEIETIRLKIKAKKCGCFSLNPEINYVDDLGCEKTSKHDPIIISVETAKPIYEVQHGRISTGNGDLDRLLLGGIPERYAVALVSPSLEEREKLISCYIEAGIESGQTTFYFTIDPEKAKAQAEEHPSGIFLFVCNPKADLMVKDLPNVYKLKGVENLTDIDVAMARGSKQVEVSNEMPKRACIDFVSDILLQHHALTTRKWLGGLIQELKSKGFTTLAIINPQMHTFEDTQSVLSLFDGEIRLAEKEVANVPVRTLRILRLQGQSYLKDEFTLN